MGAAAVQHLAEGEQVTDTLAVTSIDGTATENINVTVTGTEDAPVNEVVFPDEGTVTALPSTWTGIRTYFDDVYQGGGFYVYDMDLADTLSVTVTPLEDGHLSTGFYTLYPHQGGDAAPERSYVSWQFAVDNAALVPLAAGQTVAEQYRVSVTDGHGRETHRDVTVNLVGINEAATITGDTSGAVKEDTTLSASGQLTVADVDNGENHFETPQAAALAGKFGTFSSTRRRASGAMRSITARARCRACPKASRSPIRSR
jgi:VCBS repeat-containing protein